MSFAVSIFLSFLVSFFVEGNVFVEVGVKGDAFFMFVPKQREQKVVGLERMSSSFAFSVSRLTTQRPKVGAQNARMFRMRSATGRRSTKEWVIWPGKAIS